MLLPRVTPASVVAGTNDAYVTIQLGKEKYQTSIKERCDNPEWHEECDLYVRVCVCVRACVRRFVGLWYLPRV